MIQCWMVLFSEWTGPSQITARFISKTGCYNPRRFNTILAWVGLFLEVTTIWSYQYEISAILDLDVIRCFGRLSQDTRSQGKPTQVDQFWVCVSWLASSWVLGSPARICSFQPPPCEISRPGIWFSPVYRAVNHNQQHYDSRRIIHIQVFSVAVS